MLFVEFNDLLFFVGNKIILTYLKFLLKKYASLETKDKYVWPRRNFWIPKWCAFKMVVAFLVKNEKGPQTNQNLTDVNHVSWSRDLREFQVDWPIRGPEFYFRPNPGLWLDGSPVRARPGLAEGGRAFKIAREGGREWVTRDREKKRRAEEKWKD